MARKHITVMKFSHRMNEFMLAYIFIKGILRWLASFFSYMLELTYAVIENKKKNPFSSILTPKPALESLN